MKKKASPPPVAYSPRQLLSYWGIWMLGNAASIYLNLYLNTFFIFIAWIALVFLVLGYLFTQLHQAHHSTRIQLVWRLLLAAGVILSVIEGVFAMWFIEDCYFYGNHCYGIDFYGFTGS